MLIPRRLDDQRYEDIMREAVGRLPWLCPQWTDHNAHDPGITILELMAWYKEMQQYQMDQLTPALRRELLRLAGVTPQPPRAAVCALEVPPDGPARPALSRLTCRQEVGFELLEPVPESGTALVRVLVEQDGRTTDVRDLLAGSMELKPFSFGGHSGSTLLLGFSGPAGQPIRLWFEIAPPQGAARNPFAAGQQPPRDIEWTFVGAAAQQPPGDDTHALSQSGYVRLAPPADWPAGQDGLRWLRLTLTRPGCEEQPRLRGISDRRFQAAQQQTRARSHLFTAAPAAGQTLVLADAHARKAELAVFLRTPAGWEQTSAYTDMTTGEGRVLTVDAQGAAPENDNVLVVCLASRHAHQLLFDTLGRPGEQLYLNLDGQTALPDNFRLLCRTLCPDGVVRPAVWHCVSDLYTCGPRDRAFTYDPVRETVSFGNGQYGAVVAAGKGSVMVMDLTVSRCGMGNVPADAGLSFADDGFPVRNTAASGGSDAESLLQAGDRLLRELRQTGKCLSAADYESQARQTPGLRVAAAKALPGYDPQAPAGAKGQAVVTVVVLPASEERLPMPDGPFLQAVADRLARCRTIGIRTLVTGPRYVEITVTAQVRATAELTREHIRDALGGRLSAARADIGAAVCRSDIAALLQKLPGALEIRRVELRGFGQDAYHTAAGDIRIPPDAIAVLRQADVEIIRV